MAETYSTLQFVHVLLLVYWLGTDLGVYLCARYIGRVDLPLAERRRFLQLLLTLDMGPRTALVLMIPTGVLLTGVGGWMAMPNGIVAAVSVAAVGWLGLVWFLHLRPGAAVALRRIDYALRVAVICIAAVLGLAVLTGVGPVAPRWLGGKLLAYGGAVLAGLLLRRVLVQWARGFAELAQAATTEQGNARILTAIPAAFRYAHVLWACVLAAAFLGVAKPF